MLLKRKQIKKPTEIIETKQTEDTVIQNTAVQMDKKTFESHNQKSQTVDGLFDADSDVKIERAVKTPPHYFAKKQNMNSKKSEKKVTTGEDPFALLAECRRFTASKEMKRIKDSLTRMDELMSENISKDEYTFKMQQVNIVAAYEAVIIHCDYYINSKHPKTKSGKRRKQIVEDIKKKCEEESSAFVEASSKVYENMAKGEQKSWFSVLSTIRSESVNLDAPGREVKKTNLNNPKVATYRIANFLGISDLNAESEDVHVLNYLCGKEKDDSFDAFALDQASLVNIMSLTPEIFRYYLADVLEKDELDESLDRLAYVQNSLQNTTMEGFTKEERDAVKKRLAQSKIDAKNDFISTKKIPIEKQLLKSSAELIEYKDELMSSGKIIDSSVIAWLDTHIRHWQKIESLRENKPTHKPPRTFAVQNDDEMLLENVQQVGYQTHSNSCWSRVAQTLLNYQGVDIDQTQIRAFRRLNLNEKNYNGPDGSKSVVANSIGSLEMDVYELMLQTTDKVGMEVRQYSPDTKMHNKIMQDDILETVKHVISEYKVPIALLHGNHYRTIVGFKGNNLLIKDPQNKHDTKNSDSIREYPISKVTGKTGLEWLYELTFDEEGHCKEVEDISKKQENDTKYKWVLEDGEYRFKSITDDSYADEPELGIGGMTVFNFDSGFSITDMFRFNTKMK